MMRCVRRCAPLALALVLIATAGGFRPLAAVQMPMAPKAPSMPPAVGDMARDFTLNRLDGRPVHLADLLKSGPVVMLMLRGWVGYQCPFCNRQVRDFLVSAGDMQAAGATVVMVYPGAKDLVRSKAEEFLVDKTQLDNVEFVTDPDLQVVNLYNLRWDAPNETSYPSTFVFNRQGRVAFVKISRSHGDRSSAAEVLAVLKAM